MRPAPGKPAPRAADPGPYRAIPCPCGHPTCRAWMVDPVAAVQGVSFTEEQARAVAELLNTMIANPDCWVTLTLIKKEKTTDYSP